MTREVEQVAGVDYENGSIESYLVRGNDPACDVIGIRKTKEGARDWTRPDDHEVPLYFSAESFTEGNS